MRKKYTWRLVLLKLTKYFSDLGFWAKAAEEKDLAIRCNMESYQKRTIGRVFFLNCRV